MNKNINDSCLSENRRKYKYLTCRPSQENAGFSLLELIIVIGIMGILLSIGVSSFVSYNNQLNLANSSQKMAREINWAKNYGIVREKFCAVRVWPSDDQYQISLVDKEGVEEVITPPGEILTDENKTELDNNVQLTASLVKAGQVTNCADIEPCVFTYNYLADLWDDVGINVIITFSTPGQPDETLDIDDVTGVAYVQ